MQVVAWTAPRLLGELLLVSLFWESVQKLRGPVFMLDQRSKSGGSCCKADHFADW
jgi:hypothetical protein